MHAPLHSGAAEQAPAAAAVVEHDPAPDPLLDAQRRRAQVGERLRRRLDQRRTARRGRRRRDDRSGRRRDDCSGRRSRLKCRPGQGAKIGFVVISVTRMRFMRDSRITRSRPASGDVISGGEVGGTTRGGGSSVGAAGGVWPFTGAIKNARSRTAIRRKLMGMSPFHRGHAGPAGVITPARQITPILPILPILSTAICRQAARRERKLHPLFTRARRDEPLDCEDATVSPGDRRPRSSRRRHLAPIPVADARTVLDAGGSSQPRGAGERGRPGAHPRRSLREQTRPAGLDRRRGRSRPGNDLAAELLPVDDPAVQYGDLLPPADPSSAGRAARDVAAPARLVPHSRGRPPGPATPPRNRLRAGGRGIGRAGKNHRQLHSAAGADAVAGVGPADHPAAEGSGGRGQQGEERVPGEHEPRDSHAHERHPRHDRTDPRHRLDPRTAAKPRHGQDLGRFAAARDQRHPRLLQDRSRQTRTRPHAFCPARQPRRHREGAGPAGPREGAGADLPHRPGSAGRAGRRRAAAAADRHQPGRQRHQIHRAWRGGGDCEPRNRTDRSYRSYFGPGRVCTSRCATRALASRPTSSG